MYGLLRSTSGDQLYSDPSTYDKCSLPRTIVPTLFFKWTKPGLFLFIFVLFKQKFYIKTVGVSGIQTRIVGVEGEHADHFTTTTAKYLTFLPSWTYSRYEEFMLFLSCNEVVLGVISLEKILLSAESKYLF